MICFRKSLQKPLSAIIFEDGRRAGRAEMESRICAEVSERLRAVVPHFRQTQELEDLKKRVETLERERKELKASQEALEREKMELKTSQEALEKEKKEFHMDFHQMGKEIVTALNNFKRKRSKK